MIGTQSSKHSVLYNAIIYIILCVSIIQGLYLVIVLKATHYLQNWFLCVIRSSRAYLNWTLVHIFVRPLMEKVLLSVEMQCTWKSVSYIVIAFK